jgi:hypothetical protein
MQRIFCFYRIVIFCGWMVCPGHANAQNTFKTLLVPEFYFPDAKHIKDSTYELRCYDSRDTLLNSFNNFEEVHYVSIFKNYKDPLHTFRDENGKPQPTPLSIIINRYDRTSKTKWLSIDYPRHSYTTLTEYKEIIVKTDTLYPAGPKNTAIIYKYYKAAPTNPE